MLGYWDSNGGSQGRLEIYNPSGAFSRACYLMTNWCSAEASTSSATSRGVQMNLSDGNDIYSGENVIPMSLQVVFCIRF